MTMWASRVTPALFTSTSTQPHVARHRLEENGDGSLVGDIARTCPDALALEAGPPFDFARRLFP
jgi:hypothetical protein